MEEKLLVLIGNYVFVQLKAKNRGGEFTARLGGNLAYTGNGKFTVFSYNDFVSFHKDSVTDVDRNDIHINGE